MGRRKKNDIPVGAIGCLGVIALIFSPFFLIGRAVTGNTSDEGILLNVLVGIVIVGGISLIVYEIIKQADKSSLHGHVDANRRELEDFIRSEDTLEPQPVNVCLNANEQAYYTENDVSLGQAKTVHKREGTAVGFQVFKGLGIGSYHSEGRSFSELRHCDKGPLILTNQNLIFRGIVEQRVIPLNKILYVEEFSDAIQISQRNKKSMDYFFVRNPFLWAHLILKMRNGELFVNHATHRPLVRVISVETVPSAQRFLPPPSSPDDNMEDPIDSPPSPPPCSPSGFSNFDRSQPTSTVEQIFMGRYYGLAMEMIRRSGLQPVGRKTGYVNLDRGKACAQLHPHNQGVVLVIPELDQRCPPCTLLRQVPFQNLQGYRSSNKCWMDGDGTRWTYSPAGAFLVPGDMENQPDHPGWKEVDALLAYIKSR